MYGVQMYQSWLCEGGCGKSIAEAKAKYKQTKYCPSCASKQKRLRTLESWTPEDRKKYMRKYMRAYRKSHPGLSTPHVQKHRANKKLKLADTAQQGGSLPFDFYGLKFIAVDKDGRQKNENDDVG